MIKITNIQTYGWEAAIRGMRNPMNSWEKSDSVFFPPFDITTSDDINHGKFGVYSDPQMVVGPNDLSLMLKLAKAGSDHAKYRRMITITMDILAPLYWWKEFDTYKVGTVANSCSTMHKITEKEFTIEDFSHEHLTGYDDVDTTFFCLEADELISSLGVLKVVVEALNEYRSQFIKTEDKKYWWQLIQLLPTSYNQLRTVQLNYEVLANIYRSRREHKLDEWRAFCAEIEKLPYSEIITLRESKSCDQMGLNE